MRKKLVLAERKVARLCPKGGSISVVILAWICRPMPELNPYLLPFSIFAVHKHLVCIIAHTAPCFWNGRKSSSYLNCMHGVHFTGNQDTKHILNYIEKSDIKNVLMSENGNMSLDLAAAFEKKNFFYSRTIKKANHLLEVFLKKKVNRFFLITPKEYFDLPQKISLGDRKSVNLTYYKINLISIYRLFIVSITHS